MRTGIVEETTEANRVAAESARPGPIRSAGRAMARRSGERFEVRLAASLAELGHLLDARPPTELSRSARLERAAQLLAEATGAERVAIYLPAGSPPCSVFALAASGPGLGVAAFEVAPRLELSADQAAGRRLLAGRAVRVVHPLALRPRPVASRLTPISGWSRVGSTLQVPCVGAEGLNGVVCFEGARLDPAQADEAEAASARAEAAVALFASFLERERLGRALEGMRAERARSERLGLLGRAAGGAAHDLNNVLTAILGYADLLELELPGGSASPAGDPTCRAPRGQAELEEIRCAVARGAGLVEELLAFARPRATAQVDVDLSEVVEGLAGMARRVAGGEIVLGLRLSKGLARVRVEREAIERAVLNLIANARHAIEARPAAEGRIEVALEPVRGADGEKLDGEGADGWVRLSISDDGCGMTADVASRIFEPLFTTRAASGGTGLGLAGVAECVHRAHGRIAVESAPGVGTKIHIELPVAPPTPPAVAAPAHSTSAA